MRPGSPEDAPHVRDFREGAWRYWSDPRGGGARTLEEHLGGYPGGVWQLVADDASGSGVSGPPAEGAPRRGETLAERLKRVRAASSGSEIAFPRSRDEAVWISGLIERVASALHASHEKGRIHGDLRPARIVVTPQEDVLLLDPDPRDIADEDPYAAPEQLAKDAPAADPRVDTWALGVCLYEALTWRRPFAGARAAFDAAIAESVARPPRELNASLPRALSDVVQRAVHPNPERRYATAAELAQDLRRARAGTRPAGLVSGPRHGGRLVGALVAVTLLVTLALVISLSLLSRERDERAVLTSELLSTKERLAQVSGRLDSEIQGRRGVSTGYSPDGTRLVALFENGASASICATPDGTPEGFTRLVGHERAINSASFDRLGKLVVTASADGTAAVWEVETGSRKLRLIGHQAEVLSARFSVDGAGIVTASWDGTARVWDAKTGKVVHVLKNPAPVRMARFSPSGQHVVTLTETGKVLIFDLSSGHLLATIDGPPPPLL